MISKLRNRTSLMIVAVVGASAGNAFLNYINALLGLPLFLDSIGTAIVASLFGLLPGVVVAVVTNLMIEALAGFPWIHAPFAICGMATAVIVSLAVQRGHFESVYDVVIVTVLVTLANAILGAFIATFVYGGLTGVAIDYLMTGFVVSGRSILSASFWARVPANLVDKAIAVSLAWILYVRFSESEEAPV